MKIQAISNLQSINTNSTLNRKSTNFKGYVNGNYYKDEVIELAKKYKYNPHWKDELRKGKESIKKAISEWHYEYANPDSSNPTASRVLVGIFSLGLSEVIMNTTTAISTAVNNSGIEKLINEVAKCIDDLHHAE